MQPIQDAMVFIVDDDASVRSGLAWLLRSRGLYSQAFDGAQAFDALLTATLISRRPSMQSSVAPSTSVKNPYQTMRWSTGLSWHWRSRHKNCCR